MTRSRVRAAQSKAEQSHTLNSGTPKLSEDRARLTPYTDQPRTILVVCDRAQPFSNVVAPVMIATASVGVWDFGVITPAHPPSLAIWMRSETSNTFGML